MEYLEKATILLVDDNVNDLQLLRMTFRSLPYRVVCARDGSEALNLLTPQCRVLITDFHMPRMTGVQLAREARKIMPRLTVILCTGDDSEKVRAAAHEAGVMAVLRKPLSLREVVRLVQTEMGEQKDDVEG